MWKSPTVIRNKEGYIPFLVGLLFFAYISFLLVSNYQSQVELQDASLKRLRYDIDMRTVVVSYYFSERQSDIQGLLANRELSAFFENRDLGMSMDQGLRAGLFSISKYFESFIDNRIISGDAIYHRILFVDRDGRPLVDTKKSEGSPIAKTWADLLPPQQAKPVIQPFGSKITFSVPYFFKGRYEGQIIAWVAPTTLYDHLVREKSAMYQYVGIVTGKRNFYLPEDMPPDVLYDGLSELAKVEDGQHRVFNVTSAADVRQVTDMIALRSAVTGTPFSLVSIMPYTEVVGDRSPRQLLLTFLALAFVFVGGIILLWRANLQRLVIRTELKEAARREAIIKEKNRLLAREISERQQIAEELLLAKREAEASNRAKSHFLANMSHEIRTPMNGVLGMTELLQDSGLDSEQRQFAEILKSSGESLLAIIDDILDFSKIEAGKLELEVIAFDLQLLIEDVVQMLASRAHAKKLELAVQIPEESCLYVQGDPTRLRQVLTNLLANAIKFTDMGEVVLLVERVGLLGSEVQLKFTVNDTGIGIDPEVRQHLFKPFAQADSSTIRKYGGTGLGLAISSELVSFMGGVLECESEPGEGSSFFFTVPFEVLPEVERGRCLVNGEADLRNVRVLIVDDNATNRKILEQQTGSWEMDCECAANGVEGLVKLQLAQRVGRPFSLVLLDMQMPGMDGLEVAKKVKADPDIAKVHLVMLTSLGFRGDGPLMSRWGLAGYLIKPVRQSDLRSTLLTILGRASAKEPCQLVTRHTIAEKHGYKSMHVLVAEDNAINQEVVCFLMQKFGCRVSLAADGSQAVEAVTGNQFDLIFMDCQMPVMDGYEATAAIRQLERERGGGSRIPIIALTANALIGDREKCLEAGMDDYLSKPFRQDEILSKLETWSGRVAGQPVIENEVVVVHE